jgi:hypothetical protein
MHAACRAKWLKNGEAVRSSLRVVTNYAAKYEASFALANRGARRRMRKQTTS